MDDSLFNTSKKIYDNVKRNITYISSCQEAFADLLDEPDDIEIIDSVIEQTKIHFSKEERVSDFYYTVAIEYPFKTMPFMKTRFSDGTYPVWYGSMAILTTIYETIYHAGQYILAIEENIKENIIIQKRSIYNVFCDALLINLLNKEEDYPFLVDNDYQYNHKIGQYVNNHHYPGILSRSARDITGENVNIFKKTALSQPKHLLNLTYYFNLHKRHVEICGLENKLNLNF